jgi:hypothetical protein
VSIRDDLIPALYYDVLTQHRAVLTAHCTALYLLDSVLHCTYTTPYCTARTGGLKSDNAMLALELDGALEQLEAARSEVRQ